MLNVGILIVVHEMLSCDKKVMEKATVRAKNPSLSPYHAALRQSASREDFACGDDSAGA
jgi:hypothetical protein